MTEVLLPVNGRGLPEVWFLDGSNITLKAGTLSLWTEQQRQLPFSLDTCHDQDMTSKDTTNTIPPMLRKTSSDRIQPLDIRKHSGKLGYVSFTPPPGTTRCRLQFQPGNQTLTPAPNETQRPWWMELFADPYFNHQPIPPLYLKTSSATKLPTGGMELLLKTGRKFPILFLTRKALDFDRRLKGRRLIWNLVWDAHEQVRGYMELPVQDHIRHAQLACKFQQPPGTWSATFQRQLDSTPKTPVWYHNYNGLILMTPKATLRELHIQSPPPKGQIALQLIHVCYLIGDTITLKTIDFRKNIMHPVTLTMNGTTMQAYREIPADTPFNIKLILTDNQGRKVAESNTEQLSLNHVKPGIHQLEMTVFDQSMTYFNQKKTIFIQESPWTEPQSQQANR